MRRPDMLLILVGLVTFAFTAMAQEPIYPDPPMPQGAAESMTPIQRIDKFQGWSEERRASYEKWPANAQDYFWTLPPHRQDMFWNLTDEAKVKIAAMKAGEQEAAWRKLEVRKAMPTDDAAKPHD